MAASIPSIEPESFVAGDTVKWTKSVADYSSSDGWTLTYSIRGPAALADVVATSDGNGGYEITVPAANTINLTAGTYPWIARVTKDGEVFTVESGVIRVKQNLGTAATVTSHNAVMYEAICATLEGRATNDVDSYQIAGRSLNKIPIPELLKLKAQYALELWRERNPGKSYPNSYVTFNAA